MENNSRFNGIEIAKSLLILGFGLLTIFGVSAAVGEFTNRPQVVVTSEDVKEVIKPIACPSDLTSFENTGKKVTLIENKPSNGTSAALKGYRVTIDRSGLTSDIACGYLLYRVSFNGKPIERDYMALFMRPTYSQFGGHILPDEKRGAIISEVDKKTQVLMPIQSITYDGITRNPIKEANWASLLNVTDQIEFEIALSADTARGNLDSVQLAYKCINKETGRETDECSLKVAKTVPFGF